MDAATATVAVATVVAATISAVSTASAAAPDPASDTITAPAPASVTIAAPAPAVAAPAVGARPAVVPAATPATAPAAAAVPALVTAYLRAKHPLTIATAAPVVLLGDTAALVLPLKVVLLVRIPRLDLGRLPTLRNFDLAVPIVRLQLDFVVDGEGRLPLFLCLLLVKLRLLLLVRCDVLCRL